MKGLVICAAAAVLFGSPLVSAEPEIRKERIQLTEGAASATVKGKIKGDQIVDYQLEASAGQSLTALLKPSNKSSYFNVLPPGSEEALFVGSISGDRFEGELPSTGLFTLRVYLMRNAVRRNETSTYTLEVGLKEGDKKAAGASEKSLPSPRGLAGD